MLRRLLEVCAECVLKVLSLAAFAIFGSALPAASQRCTVFDFIDVKIFEGLELHCSTSDKGRLVMTTFVDVIKGNSGAVSPSPLVYSGHGKSSLRLAHRRESSATSVSVPAEAVKDAE